jgi:predicted unusual protein kinase regulating ubiquinone biosynthesis (AarF/ABC1/UbiB family)
MSDSTTQTQPPTNTKTVNGNGAKFKLAPLPPEQYANGNGKAHRAVAGDNGHIPASAGARIPIAVAPLKKDRPGDNAASDLLGAARASIPDVMAPENLPEAEPVEQQVNRLRPRSIRMQLRFLYTLVFALWLFGRLVFWQVYAARWFPGWVNGNNTKRWRKYAREFSVFATRMGGVMIKAGQFASTRADIMPEEVIAELAGLQDRVPTVPFQKIHSVLEAELGNVEERYEWIDPNPLAAASLGQVHRARLRGGEGVVVKVQRPNVRDIVYTDMAALFIVGHVAMRFGFVRRRADAVMIIDEFGRVLLEEISYEKESEHANRFQRMFAGNDGVYVPAVYRDHSTDKILTLEDVTSIKIDDYDRLAMAGIDRKEVARRLMDTYMQQIFEDRFFHADPHPGNLFVYPLPVEDEAQYIGKGGRPFYLVFIDFGMTGTLTREIVQGLINTLTAVITRDAHKLVMSYQELGFLLPNADTRRIEEATQAVFNEVWGMSMTDITSMDFSVVENIGREFSDLLREMPFRVPQDFVYLGRTVSILSGMATKLDPDYNPWSEIQRSMQHLIITDQENNIFDEFSKIITDAVNEVIADGPQGFLRVAERTLKQFQRVSRSEQILEQIIKGEISLETRMSSAQRYQLERIETQNRRTSRMFIVGSLLVCATLLYTNGDGTLAIGAIAASGAVWVSSWFIRP